MTQDLTFINTRKLLNQRRKTHHGGEQRLQQNLTRNRILGKQMNEMALTRLTELEKVAPATYNKMKQNFFHVSQDMYNLAQAIKSVDSVINSKPSQSSLFPITGSKTKTNNSSPNIAKQKTMVRTMKNNFFQVSSSLYDLADSMKEFEDVIPGMRKVNSATAMNNYVRKNNSTQNTSSVPKPMNVPKQQQRYGLFKQFYGLF